MPTLDSASGLPLVSRSGPPADGCGCCDGQLTCCPILCGKTPIWIDVTLNTESWAAWYNAIPASWGYRAAYSLVTGAGVLQITESQALTDFTRVARCVFTGEISGGCQWVYQEENVAGFKIRVLEDYVTGKWSEWKDIQGRLTVIVRVSGEFDTEGNPYRKAKCRVLFEPRYTSENYPGDLGDCLKGDNGAIDDNEDCGYCEGGSIFIGEFIDCPITLLGKTFDNALRAYNDGVRDGSPAPGIASIEYGPTGCDRTDCSGDCGFDVTQCPDVDALRECIGCVDALIVMTSDTDSGFSKFDFFTYADTVAVLVIDDPYSETPAVGFANFAYGSYGNVWASLTCTGKKPNGTWGWYFQMSASETNDDNRNYIVSLRLTTDNPCPPTSFTLTSANAEAWTVPDGVTYINFAIGC